jgi:hypothetical protein
MFDTSSTNQSQSVEVKSNSLESEVRVFNLKIKDPEKWRKYLIGELSYKRWISISSLGEVSKSAWELSDFKEKEDLTTRICSERTTYLQASEVEEVLGIVIPQFIKEKCL